jgi:hypothetical protein
VWVRVAPFPQSVTHPAPSRSQPSLAQPPLAQPLPSPLSQPPPSPPSLSQPSLSPPDPSSVHELASELELARIREDDDASRAPGTAASASSAGGSRDGEEEEPFAAAAAAAFAKAAGSKTSNAWLHKLQQLQASNIEGGAGEGAEEEERQLLSWFSDDLFSEEIPKCQRSLEVSVDETEDDNPPPPVIPFIKYASPGPPKSAWLSPDCTQPEFRILSLDGGGVRGTHLLRQCVSICAFVLVKVSNASKRHALRGVRGTNVLALYFAVLIQTCKC